MKNLYILFVLLAISLTSCLKDELAFDVIESPVKASFSQLAAPDGMIMVEASFVELDKSGILDQNVGILETPIASLGIKVFVFEDTEVGSLTTDSNGKVVFESSLATLEGAGKLEWVGEHNGTPFRIYFNI